LIADEASPLERTGGCVHRGATRPEHQRQELLCKREGVAPDSVLRYEHPAGAAFLDRMHPIARGRLRHKIEECLRVPAQNLPYWLMPPNVLAEALRTHTQRLAFNLAEDPRWNGSSAQEYWQTQHAFIAHSCDLHGTALFQESQYREDAVHWEKDVVDRAMRLVERFPERNADGVKVGLELIQHVGRQQAQ
jgi:hypothetical protein